MPQEYAGQAARQACAVRTREELLQYAPARPLPFRDELRVRGMHGRCELCRACPVVVKALAAMLPAPVEEKPTAVVLQFKLAS